MPTFKITVSYDGTEYAGWQVQQNANTVQAEIERAVEVISQQRVRVTGSGRTDSGVHAIAQVASFTVDKALPVEQWVRALNGNLPEDIRVHSVERVRDDFHPIRDAISKRYRYVLQDGPLLDVFHQRFAHYVRGTLDLEAMHKAATLLLGVHDFSAFEAVGSPRASSIRNIVDVSIIRTSFDHQLIWFEIEADGFLYNMVRNIVGTLIEVGTGRRSPTSMTSLLDGRDRKLAGQTAPAQGLHLLAVRYGSGL